VGAAVTGPSVVGSVVYLGASDGTLAAFDASGCGQATCSALWTTNVGAGITNPVAVGAGRVYASDDGGTLHAYALP
jgi:outer membrane protein assembly factor BamB